MDSSGSMQSNEERGVEKAMDDYLRSIGFQRKKIAKDGSCLFRAVAEQVLHCQSLHAQVRARCVEFLRKNRDQYEAFIEGDFEDYLWKLQDPQQWVGEVEISALSAMYKRDFLIYQEPGKPAVNITDKNFKDKVLLCFLNGNHYDSVYPLSRVKNTALCQSILYELLYGGVFKVDRGSLGPCQRVGRASDLLIDDSMAACNSSDESDLDTGEPLWVENGTSSTSTRQNYRGRGRGRLLPERVRRSLNPTLLRNIEYDVWHKTKQAQQKMDYSIAAGMHFTVGDHCQVRLEGSKRSYNATIQEVPSSGPVTVFIEELGRKQVPLWNLRPSCDENSWSSVVSKKLSNGHGEWEERGKGRGRGKSIQASSSPVSQAPGSGGRMQKQHSWPPQASADEQGGMKSSRKSVSSAEPAFGLTEEQRLAREEEAKNVLLMEIQLRDEHSFPALGPATQGEGGGGGGGGGRRKGGEKKRPQRNKTKSPVEDVRAPSPSAGERPKSSTPPAAPANLPVNSDSVKVAAPHVNMSAAAAPPPKTSAESSASAAAAPPSPPPPPPAVSTKPPSAGGAPPMPPSVPSSASIFSCVTPVLPAASSPPTSLATSSSSPPSSSSSKLPTSLLPPDSAASPPHPPPTFIAPIAPSATAAQGFSRSSSPVFSVPHAPSPPTSSTAHVQEAPPAPPQSTNSLPKPGGTLVTSQTQLHPQVLQDVSVPPSFAQTQSQASLVQNQIPQIQPEAQQQPQLHSEASSLPQTHLQAPAHPPPGASYPPDVHMQAPPPPPHQPNAQSQTETPQHPETCPPSSLQPAHPPPPPLPHPQSIPGTVPLQQLSQLYQDPLYPGFPQGENGSVAPPPPLSSSSSGDDLPRDINILKFFFNLGVKAYTLPMCPPYIYLLPLQQAHALNPKPSSRSPSPHYPPSRHLEPYPPPQYPPSSAPPQYDHQAPPPEPSHPSEPSFSQAGYPAVTQPPAHRMSWQQMSLPRNPSYPVGYPSPTPTYTVPPASAQGHHPAHPLYPPPVPPYAQSSLGYRSSSTPEEVSVGQGPMEQHQPPNGDVMSGHGHTRVHAPVESPGAANVANANKRTVMVPSSFGGASMPLSALKKDPGESLTRAVLLVDPPLNNTPILALVSDPDVKDLPVSMTTIKPSGSPASSSFRGPRPVSSNKAYLQLGPPEPVSMSYLAEPLSVGCSTEDDREEMEAFKAKTLNYRGQRRGYRRGRGGHDPGRGHRRRYGEGYNPVQFNSSHRVQGREHGY